MIGNRAPTIALVVAIILATHGRAWAARSTRRTASTSRGRSSSSTATLEPSIHAPRKEFLFFYNENDPNGVLGGMERPLAKLK